MLAAPKRLTGYNRIAMTGNADGRLNHMCEHYIRIPCGQENVGPKTKGYTATVLMLYLMALEAGKRVGILTDKKREEYINTLEKAGEQYRENSLRRRFPL